MVNGFLSDSNSCSSLVFHHGQTQQVLLTMTKLLHLAVFAGNWILSAHGKALCPRRKSRSRGLKPKHMVMKFYEACCSRSHLTFQITESFSQNVTLIRTKWPVDASCSTVTAASAPYSTCDAWEGLEVVAFLRSKYWRCTWCTSIGDVFRAPSAAAAAGGLKSNPDGGCLTELAKHF